MTVTVPANSAGSVQICKTTVGGNTTVEVTADRDAEYEVEDLAPGDTVNVGTDQQATISGTGGTVNQSASSGHGSVSVPANGSIEVNLVTGGNPVTVDSTNSPYTF